MKLKILYICYEDLSGYNGAIRHVTEIVRELSRNGRQIDLCVPKLGRKSSGLNEEANNDQVTLPNFLGIKILNSRVAF